MAQANAQIGVAKAAYFPNISLSAVGGLGNTSLTSWFTWPSRFWSVGPSVAETIFDAGLRRATMDQYRANYDQTVANYRETVLVAFQQVEDNLASLRILSQTIQQQDAAVEAAARGLREATVRYKAGLDPYLNVIVAQTILLSDQQTAVNFRMEKMVSSVQLIKALGGGWDVKNIPPPDELKSGTFKPDATGTIARGVSGVWSFWPLGQNDISVGQQNLEVLDLHAITIALYYSRHMLTTGIGIALIIA